MKILNLYAGIDGNRKLWQNVKVIAIENNPQIAKIYQDFFPNDKVILGDAHQYLLEHFKEFDFIWSSPPLFPCDFFDLAQPEEQKKCFHYSNLQPLYAKDNRFKWHKIPEVCYR